MKNRRRIVGDVAHIIIDRRDGSEVITVLDASDLAKADEFENKWTATYNAKIGSFYVNGQIRGRFYYLHRWLTDAPTGMVVDHINGEPLDNRRRNLRVVTVAQNNQNLRAEGRRGHSGVRGVTWHKKAGKWMAQCKVGDTYRYLGLYEDLEEATRVVSAVRAEIMPYSAVDQEERAV